MGLFSDQPAVDDLHQRLLVVLAEGYLMFFNGKFVASEGLYLIDGDDIGFMYPQESGWWQLFFDGL